MRGLERVKMLKLKKKFPFRMLLYLDHGLLWNNFTFMPKTNIEICWTSSPMTFPTSTFHDFLSVSYHQTFSFSLLGQLSIDDFEPRWDLLAQGCLPVRRQIAHNIGIKIFCLHPNELFCFLSTETFIWAHGIMGYFPLFLLYSRWRELPLIAGRKKGFHESENSFLLCMLCSL